MKNNDEILIGACDVYMYEFTGTEIPEHATIETEEHDVGHCSSGFTVNYKPTKYDVKNQYGQIVKSAITEEAISAKTGVLSWNLANMSLLSTGVYTEDKAGKKKDLIFTGDGKALKTVLLRAVHTKENGKKIRFTMIGQEIGRAGRIGICNRVGEQRSNDRCRINGDQESKRFPCKF